MYKMAGYCAFIWAIAGILLGIGTLFLVAALGGMWFGNGLSGLLTNRISPLTKGAGSDLGKWIEKSERPSAYWFHTITELVLSAACIFVIMKMLREAGIT